MILVDFLSISHILVHVSHIQLQSSLVRIRDRHSPSSSISAPLSFTLSQLYQILVLTTTSKIAYNLLKDFGSLLIVSAVFSVPLFEEAPFPAVTQFLSGPRRPMPFSVFGLSLSNSLQTCLFRVFRPSSQRRTVFHQDFPFCERPGAHISEETCIRPRTDYEFESV